MAYELVAVVSQAALQLSSESIEKKNAKTRELGLTEE